ncbi:hypothetical protein AB0K18_35905 [Nonomuraea sp. NPDC049421]|uniref:hypothetical protein n=1 Tax=Nonomuraea sp. NPDC049421 TaxID=3155275 RepID=UPI00341B0CC4
MDALVCAAGIAGPALAYWLRHHGFAPTVVERAPRMREGGYAAGLRGEALDVLDRMALLEQAEALDLRLGDTAMADEYAAAERFAGEGRPVRRLLEEIPGSAAEWPSPGAAR